MKFEVGKTYSSTYGEIKTLTIIEREGGRVTVRYKDINSSQLIEEDSDGEYFNFIWGWAHEDIIRADQERIRAQQSAVIYALNESRILKENKGDYSVKISHEDNGLRRVLIESRDEWGRSWEFAYISLSPDPSYKPFWYSGGGILLETDGERLKRFFDLLLNHFNREAYFTESRVLSTSPDEGRLEVYRQVLRPEN